MEDCQATRAARSPEQKQIFGASGRMQASATYPGRYVAVVVAAAAAAAVVGTQPSSVTTTAAGHKKESPGTNTTQAAAGSAEGKCYSPAATRNIPGP